MRTNPQGKGAKIIGINMNKKMSEELERCVRSMQLSTGAYCKIILKQWTSHQSRSRRNTYCTLVSQLLFILLLVEQTAHAGRFYDGAVRVDVGGSLAAQGTWASDGVNRNYNVGSIVTGGVYSASDFKLSNRSTMISGSTYALENGADVLISGEIMVGNGRATLDLFAETLTTASLSSSDHGGVPVNNNTSGSAVVFGSLIVALPASVPYSVLKITSDTLPGDRYVESEGSYISLSEIDSGDASSFTIAPAGVPGAFSDNDSGTYSAGVQLTVIYGQGATQGNAILPSGPATDAPGAQSVINSAMGSSGPGMTYKPGSTETFNSVPKGRWYDPSISYGFVYEALGGTLFTEIINLPDGFSGSFSIRAEGQLLGYYGAGDFLNFEELLGHGISSFAVLGITPENDQDVVDVFPIQLDFNSEPASFRQHALEPIVRPPLALSALTNGWMELRWPAEVPSVLQQSTTLTNNSWSTALDQGENAGDGELRVVIDPNTEEQFFRLILEADLP